MSHFLVDKFLIAMPGMTDPNFTKTVTYVVKHSERGAMGIVINRPTKMHLAQVFEQLQLPCNDAALESQPVMQGGPVQTEQGFVIHRPSGTWEYSMEVSNSIHITTSRDILASMARGDGPHSVMVALGYAGWDAGQLEAELTANAWLTVDYNENLLFEVPFEQRWRAAGRLLGIDVTNLATDAGHA